MAKPPVSHVTAVPANNPFLLNTVHSVQEGKLDQTIGKNIGDLDGTNREFLGLFNQLARVISSEITVIAWKRVTVLQVADRLKFVPSTLIAL